MEATAKIIDDLITWERELHAAHAWRGGRAVQLLHADFIEIGYSGAIHTRASVLAQFSKDSHFPTRHAQNFEARLLHPDVALLTYRSAEVGPRGELSKFALRSSLWQRGSEGWQIRFHQGTATHPFERAIE